MGLQINSLRNGTGNFGATTGQQDLVINFRRRRPPGWYRFRTTYRNLTKIALAMDRARWSGAECTEYGLSVREPEHLMLARPCDRRVEQASDADPVWQSTFDGGFDEVRCQEGQRDRHVDVARAASLPCGDAVDCRGAGLDLGQPSPSARDCGDELPPGVGADR